MIKLNIKRFASGTIPLSLEHPSSSVTFQGKIEWSSTAVSGTNTSNVTAKLYARKQGSSTATSGTKWSGYVTINGTRKDYNTGSLSVSNDWKLIYTAPTVSVTHTSDGSKSITIAGSVKGPSGTTLANITSSGSGTATMDRIYRQSSLTSVNINITTTNGNTTASVTANGTKYVSTYTDNLTLSANNQTIGFNGITFGRAETLTDAQKTTLWNMFGNNMSVTISCYITTMSGSTTIGKSNTINTVANLPEHTITPTCSWYDMLGPATNQYKEHPASDLIANDSSPLFTFSASSSTGDFYGCTPTFSLIFTNASQGEEPIVFENITSSYGISSTRFTNDLSTPVILRTQYRDTTTDIQLTNTNIIPYVSPSAKFRTMNRNTPTSQIVSISLDTSYYDGTGLKSSALSTNQVSLTYKVGSSGTPVTISQNDMTLVSHTVDSTTHVVTDRYDVSITTSGVLDYQEEFYADLYSIDLIGKQSAVKSRTLPRGVPLWYGYSTSQRAQHMVVEGTLHTQNWLEVEHAADFNGPAYFYDIVESDKAPRFGSVNTQEENYLPDGDLNDPYFWCGLKNGWYYLSPNTGTYEHAPYTYCWIFKNGYYSEEQSLSNFEVWLYGVNGEIVLRTKGNANTTTCVWNRLVNNAAMTINLGSAQQITTNSATKINLNTTRISSGYGLTYSNYGIRIGVGINHVMVTGSACVSAFTGNGLRRFLIYKNSTAVSRGQLYQHTTYSGTYNNIPIPAQVVAVTEGDVIYMYTQSNGTNTTVYQGGLDTYLTVQVVD